MNDPGQPHDDLRRPVGGSRSLAEEGCLKPLLLGCGSIALFLGIALFVLILKSDDLLRWTLETVQSQVVSVLPDDLDPERRERLTEAFAASREALASGKVDSSDLQRFQAALIDYSRAAAGGLTVDDVDRLIDALESLGGAADEAAPTERSRETEPPDRVAPVALLVAPGWSG